VTNGYGATVGILANPYVRAVPLISTDVLGTKPKVIPRYGVQLFAEGYAINPAYRGILKASITVWSKKFRRGAHLGGTILWN